MSLLTFLASSFVWTSVVAGGAEWLTRKNMTPHGAQALWRMAAGLMVLPWIAFGLGQLMPELVRPVPLALPWPELVDVGALVPAEFGSEAATSTAQARPLTWIAPVVLSVLVMGWLVRLVAGAAGQIWLRRLQTRRYVLNDSKVEDALARAAKLAGLRRPPAISGLNARHSPFVSGLVRPVLYLPKTHLKGDGLDFVLLHECLHIARGDLVTRPLERLVADLIWFSPFAWLARQRLDHWREAVCDADAVRLSGDRVGYARALVETARTCRPASPPGTVCLPAATLFSSPKRTLTMRISSLVDTPDKTRSRRRLAGGLILAFLATPLAIAHGLGEQDGAHAGTVAFGAAIIDHPDAKITSRFGNRIHPISKKEMFHSGIDIGAPFGTPVLLPAAGEVITTGERRGYGLVVEVELDGTRDRLRFAQLQSYRVKVGDRLVAGDPIGAVGASGRATGPHLHLEYLDRSDDNQPSDPEAIEGLQLIAGE